VVYTERATTHVAGIQDDFGNSNFGGNPACGTGSPVEQYSPQGATEERRETVAFADQAQKGITFTECPEEAEPVRFGCLEQTDCSTVFPTESYITLDDIGKCQEHDSNNEQLHSTRFGGRGIFRTGRIGRVDTSQAKVQSSLSATKSSFGSSIAPKPKQIGHCARTKTNRETHMYRILLESKQ